MASSLRFFYLSAFICLFCSGALPALQQIERVEQLFDIGRQTLVFGRKNFFMGNRAYEAGDKPSEQKRKEGQNCYDTTETGSGVVEPGATRLYSNCFSWDIYVQYAYLWPYSIRAAVPDSVSTHNFTGSGNFRDIPLAGGGKILSLDLAFDLTYVNIISRGIKNIESIQEESNILFGWVNSKKGSYGLQEGDAVNYGSFVQTATSAGFNLWQSVSWKTNFYYDATKVQNPQYMYIDHIGNLRFYENAAESSTRRFALFDQFEFTKVGLTADILHGEQLWNLAEAQMLHLKERIGIRPWRLMFLAAYRSYNANTNKYLEPGIAFTFRESQDQGMKRGSRIEAGVRTDAGSFDLAALRAALVLDDLPAYIRFKIEITHRLRNLAGNIEPATGGAIGLGLGGGDIGYEFVFYRNHLDAIDLIPALKDTNYFKAALKMAF